MKSTGYHSAAAVKPGTTIERIYFAVPAYGWIGQTFDNYIDALDHAITEQAEAVEQSKAHTGGTNYVGERVTVDTRWVMKAPNGGGADTVMARDEYATLDEARQSLATRRRYARNVVPS